VKAAESGWFQACDYNRSGSFTAGIGRRVQ
jgi:hypothetical protein